MLDLKQPIYKQTAAYGHFGRTDVLLPWEKLDKVNLLKDAVEIQWLLKYKINNYKIYLENKPFFYYN